MSGERIHAVSAVSRRECLALLAGTSGGALMLLPGCGALQSLDTSARGEGTGIQIIGALVVLAKYRATPRQKGVAEQKARRAFVDRAMRPALAAEKKKVRAKRERQVQTVKSQPQSPQREQALVKLEKETSAELASLETSWRETASRYTSGRYTADFAVQRPVGTVAFATLKESEVLTASAAYVPRNLAVSVPAEKQVAGAAASVMFWDTQSHQLARDEVYVVDRQPKVGELAKFDDISAEFVQQ